MPFRSQAQMKWAFANRKPWAHKVADATPKAIRTGKKRAKPRKK
jgi:hypothetical protein